MELSISLEPKKDEADSSGPCTSESRSRTHIPPFCNPETLKSWLSTCETTHPWCPWKHPTRPIQFRLLDVHALCIKDFLNTSDQQLTYAALSYVWGAKPQRLRLTRTNQDALYREGGIEACELSKTLSDAVSVVRMLGERYIWIDSLCIVQDSNEDLESQIPFVGYIYAKALVTIVAASGDHNDAGLPGINGTQRPTSAQSVQQLPLAKSDQSENEVYSSMPPLQIGTLDYLEDTVWETRGWTY